MPTSAAQELTDVDGVDRSDAEVIIEGPPFSDSPPEDWKEQAKEAEIEQAGKQALDDLIAAKVAEQVAKILAVEPGAPKVLRANVYDRFMTGGNVGTPLRHFRCDAAHSTKMIELDMDLLEDYEQGNLDIPRNEKNRPDSIIGLAVMPGRTIDWIEGHAYPTTDNQVRNILRAKRLGDANLHGGMPGIYEDVGGTAEWICTVCQNGPKFGNEQTYTNHMQATHGVVASVVAPALTP